MSKTIIAAAIAATFSVSAMAEYRCDGDGWTTFYGSPMTMTEIGNARLECNRPEFVGEKPGPAAR